MLGPSQAGVGLGVRTDSTRTRSDQVPSPQNPAGAALRANTRVLRASTAWCGPGPLHPLQLLPVTMCCCFWNTQSVLLSQGLRSCHFLCLECSLFGPRHVCLTFQVTTTLYRIVPPLLPAPIPTTVCFKRRKTNKQTYYYGEFQTQTKVENSLMSFRVRIHHPASVINHRSSSCFLFTPVHWPFVLKCFDPRHRFILQEIFVALYLFIVYPILHPTPQVPSIRLGRLFFLFFSGLFCLLLYIQHLVQCLVT